MGRVERVPAPARAARDLVGAVRPVSLAAERSLPVVPALGDLFPGGLLRGTTVEVGGPAGAYPEVGGPAGASSLLLALMAAASQAGSWCAVVAVEDLGPVAAAEVGLDLGRVALVPRVPPERWPVTVSGLLDALDIVAARPPPRLGVGEARRLSARAKERGSILLVAGSWREGADVRLKVVGARWEGVGAGQGHLRRRLVVVEAAGRGAFAREQRVKLWLPGPEGRPAPALVLAPGATTPINEQRFEQAAV